MLLTVFKVKLSIDSRYNVTMETFHVSMYQPSDQWVLTNFILSCGLRRWLICRHSMNCTDVLLCTTLLKIIVHYFIYISWNGITIPFVTPAHAAICWTARESFNFVVFCHHDVRRSFEDPSIKKGFVIGAHAAGFGLMSGLLILCVGCIKSGLFSNKRD